MINDFPEQVKLELVSVKGGFLRTIRNFGGVPDASLENDNNFTQILSFAAQYLGTPSTPQSWLLCLTTCQFFNSVLFITKKLRDSRTCDFPPLQMVLVNCLINRLEYVLSSYTASFQMEFLCFPNLVFILGLLSRFFSESSQFSGTVDFIKPFHKHWETFGQLVTMSCSKALDSARTSSSSEESEILLFEILRFWKRALSCLVTARELDDNKLDSAPFVFLANALRAALLSTHLDPLCLTSRMSVWHNPILCHLLLRSLRSLSKRVTDVGETLSVVRSVLDDTWIRILCPKDDAINSQSLLHSNFGFRCVTFERSLSLEPDQDVCLRLVMLANLEIGCRPETSELIVENQLRSLRTLLVESEADEMSTYEASIVALLLGDDQHLFMGLILWIKMVERLGISQGQIQYEHLIPNVHRLFAAFAKSIDYSAHLLVDWIVSPETDCLMYLLLYLRFFRQYSAEQSRSCSGRCACVTSDTSNTLIRCSGCSIAKMFKMTARCLRLLHAQGNIPFSPMPLVYRLEDAVSSLRNTLSQTIV